MEKKHVVKFTRAEGLAPAVVEGMVVLRTPMWVPKKGRTPDDERTVDLGIKCNVPLMLFTAPFAESQGYKLTQEGKLVMPSTNIVITMKALAEANEDLQERDSVVIAFPLLSEFDISVE